jgi:transcriptional regulator with XRE-family HTH domain
MIYKKLKKGIYKIKKITIEHDVVKHGMKNISDIIRFLRIKNSYTVEDVCKKLGFSKKKYKLLESGKLSGVYINDLVKIFCLYDYFVEFDLKLPE